MSQPIPVLQYVVSVDGTEFTYTNLNAAQTTFKALTAAGAKFDTHIWLIGVTSGDQPNVIIDSYRWCE